jgi:WD40 repeat protein
VASLGETAEEWMGLPRANRALVSFDSAIPEGQAALITRQGELVVSLWPFVQIRAPSPGEPSELFLFDGTGRLGARLVAPPRMFEQPDEALWDWFRGAIVDLEQSSPSDASTDKPPYRGLSSFSTVDADNYFGREREAQAFANRLRIQTLLAVVGPSGVGKSSFVQAGVVPLLPNGWRALVVRPGPTPLAAMAARLSTVGVQTQELKEALKRSPTALRDRLKEWLPPGGGLVLVVDQFEELLTLCHDADERALYAEALVSTAGEPSESIRVVLTLRDDFLIRAQRLVPLRDRLAQGLQLLATPEPADLERTLTEPARRAGFSFEDPELPKRMAAEMSDQSGALAILSFTASKLWEVRDRRLKRLTRKAYEALGGVGGALAQHAEETLAGMKADEQKLTREAFRHLVSAEGTRAIITRAELHELLGGTEAAERVLEALIGARLLVASEGAGANDQVEVIHEALLSSWPRLVQWLREDSENARMRDLLRAAARQWEERGQARGVLWRGDALAEYRSWRRRYPGALTAVEQAFGRQSLREEARGRQWRRTLLGLAFATLCAGLAVLYAANDRAADRLRRLHMEQGRVAMLAQKPLRGLVYLATAYEEGMRGAGLSYLLGKGVRFASAQLKNLEAPGQRLRVTALSPDEKTIAGGSADGSLVLWDAATGVLLRTISAHDGAVGCVHFSPDSSRLLTCGEDKLARVWDAATGEVLFTLSGHQQGVRGGGFSPDGAFIVTASQDGTARIWNSTDGANLRTLSGHTVGIGEVAFSPDGKNVVTFGGQGWAPGGDKQARVWELATGEPRALLVDHGLPILAVAFSPDGTRLATASADKTVDVYDTARWQRLFRLEGHWGGVTGVAFHPRGGELVTSSKDRTVRRWSSQTGQLLSVLTGHDGPVRLLAYSPDGEQLVSASDDGQLRLWNAQSGRPLMLYVGHTSGVRNIQFFKDGLRVLSGSSDHTVKIWSTQRRLNRLSLEDTEPATWSRFSLDGKRLYTASGDKRLKAWNAETGALLETLAFEGADAYAPAFTPDQQQIITEGLGDFSPRVWSLSPLKPRLTLAGHSGRIEHVDVSPVGGLVVTSSTDKTARVWSLDDGRQLFVLHHPTSVQTAVFSRDGKRVATGGWDGLVRLWNATTGELQATLQGHRASVGSAEFSPDGRTLLTGSTDQTARLWDLQRESLVGTLEGHSGWVNNVSFSPDGELLLTSGADGEVWVWERKSLTHLDTLSVGQNVSSAWFSPDGKSIALTGFAGNISFVNVDQNHRPPAELSRFVRCHVPYVLSGEGLAAIRSSAEGCGR